MTKKLFPLSCVSRTTKEKDNPGLAFNDVRRPSARVMHIGAGLSFTTIIGKTSVAWGLRHYHEFDAEHRWEGNQTIASGTIRF
jgi:hypothetical protein